VGKAEYEGQVNGNANPQIDDFEKMRLRNYVTRGPLRLEVAKLSGLN